MSLKPMTAEERLAALEAELAAKNAELAQTKAALAAKQAGGTLSWYIANDTMPAGEPDAVAMRACTTQAERVALAGRFCKGSISVKGINARFPITLYREQWLRFLDGVEPDADPKAPFIRRFVAYLTSPACIEHYAVKAASERKAATK